MKNSPSLDRITHYLKDIEDMPVALAERNWLVFNIPTPVDGDPH